MQPITITLDNYTITIHIEKEDINTNNSPIRKYPPIQYHDIQAKRIYYKKWDPQYKRKPLPKLSQEQKKRLNLFLMTSKSDKAVKQEPLLAVH